jgi:hypothetical protein
MAEEDGADFFAPFDELSGDGEAEKSAEAEVSGDEEEEDDDSATVASTSKSRKGKAKAAAKKKHGKRGSQNGSNGRPTKLLKNGVRTCGDCGIEKAYLAFLI